jgi:hypothetical protein
LIEVTTEAIWSWNFLFKVLNYEFHFLKTIDYSNYLFLIQLWPFMHFKESSTLSCQSYCHKVFMKVSD